MRATCPSSRRLPAAHCVLNYVPRRIRGDVLRRVDLQPHPRRAGQRLVVEVALPALVALVALLVLDDAAALAGHAVPDDGVLRETRLQPSAPRADGCFPRRGI